MTSTTSASHIPAEGLRHEAGALVATATPHPQAGYRIQVRIAGVFSAELSSGHTYEYDALVAWRALVAQYPVAAEAAPARLTPAAKGTKTYMSPAEVLVIGQALDSTGHIRRGRALAAADLNMLHAMARRGFIDLTGPRFRPDGGDVTDWGKRIYKETVANTEAQQDRTDRLNRAPAITAA